MLVESTPRTASDPLVASPSPPAASATNGRAGSPLLWWSFVVLAYLLATVVMTWPYAAHLGNSLPPQWDPPLQVWVMRWVQHALATDPRGLYDANIFYPLDNTLAYTDSNIPAAIIGAPLFILTGNAILTYNILLLGTFLLAGAGMCALLTHLSGKRAVGFLAGLAYAFLPYRYDHIWHLNQLSHAWTPWAVLALLLLVKRQTWWLAIACGAVAAIQVVSSFYVGFQLALALGVLLLAALIADRRARTVRFFSRLLLAGVVFAAITVPLAWPYLQVREQQGLVRGFDEATYLAAMPGSYLKVPMHNRVWGWLNDEHILAGDDTLFPGGLAVLGALGGVWVGLRRRRALTVALLAMAAVAFVISLGPVWNARGGGTTPLPYKFLFDHFPLFGAMRVPARFGALVDFAVVTLGGLGAGWAWERFGPRLRSAWAGPVGSVAIAVVAVLLLVELGAVPVRVEPAQPTPDAAALNAWLAGQPDDGAVLHLPQSTANQFANARYQVESTQHWHPLVYGYSGFIPARQQELIATFTDNLPRADGSIAERVNFVSADNVGILQDLGVRYLIVHREGYTDEDWSAVLAQLAAAPGALEAVDGFGDDLRLYRVLPTAAPPVTLDLVVPTAAAHGIYWEPTLIIKNPSGRAALTSRELFRPVTLTVHWPADPAARRACGRVGDPSATGPTGATGHLRRADRPHRGARYPAHARCHRLRQPPAGRCGCADPGAGRSRGPAGVARAGRDARAGADLGSVASPGGQLHPLRAVDRAGWQSLGPAGRPGWLDRAQHRRLAARRAGAAPLVGAAEARCPLGHLSPPRRDVPSGIRWGRAAPAALPQRRRHRILGR